MPRYNEFSGGPPKGWEATSILKMKKQPPERNIDTLTSVFPYRGDKLKWTEDRNMTAGSAVEHMEFTQQCTHYRLQWRVKWSNHDTDQTPQPTPIR